jgi:hypothetical protein
VSSRLDSCTCLFRVHASVTVPGRPMCLICAVPAMSAVAVLLRGSVLGRTREIADSRCADIRLHTPALTMSSERYVRRRILLATLLLAKVYSPKTAPRCHHGGETRRAFWDTLASAVRRFGRGPEGDRRADRWERALLVRYGLTQHRVDIGRRPGDDKLPCSAVISAGSRLVPIESMRARVQRPLPDR